jgi:hypothetical protein
MFARRPERWTWMGGCVGGFLIPQNEPRDFVYILFTLFGQNVYIQKDGRQHNL